MLTLTEEQLDWVCKRIPDPPRGPRGGRPTADKRTVVAGIFWILDNGAKWKDLPRHFGSKSTVHRWFKAWVEAGVFETILNDAARLVERRGEYRLYECFIDGSFSKAKVGERRWNRLHKGRKRRQDHGLGGRARSPGSRGHSTGQSP
jgi:transposase